MPWSALPGRAAGRYLLEDYALAFIPHSQFLLDQLLRPRRRPRKEDLLLAVGSIDFGAAPSPVDLQALIPPVSKAYAKAPLNDTDAVYRQQSDRLLAAIPASAAGRTLAIVRHSDPSTERVTALLPKACWVVFYTHGAYKPELAKPASEPTGDSFSDASLLRRGERDTAVLRNPFTMTWLHMAGSLRPRPTDAYGVPTTDGGRLRAESIATLPLADLELADISACQIGLGSVAGGEGVFNFPRAFHQAGTANVVASLWSLPIDETMEIKMQFHRKLWIENKSVLQALRESQLDWLNTRRNLVKKALSSTALKNVDPDSLVRSKTGLWAGLFLSGAGI
jgi:CHAT domain-containing protein